MTLIYERMQNSCSYGDVAKTPWRVSVPRKPPEEVKKPDIRSRETRNFKERDMEYSQTEQPVDYEVFIRKPMKKSDKRTTCIRAGSEEYQTQRRK